MIKACIFDLDGTLVDSVESIAYSANRAITDFGFRPHPVDNYNGYAGDGVDMMLKRSLLAAGDTNLEFFNQVLAKYKEYFATDCLYQVKPYEGMVEVLHRFKKQEKRLAVLTNKSHERAVDVITAIFGNDVFDIVLGQSDWIKRKPDPQGALHIANAFGVLQKECMYVGDTDTDMKTGNAAGMFTVGVTWGFRNREELTQHHAQVIVDSSYELLELREEL